MSNKDGFDYFKAYSKQAAYAQEIVLDLKNAIEAGELGTRDLTDALHTVENDADQVNHDILDHLIGDFVVPLERDGMSDLAHALDDVSDAVEDVAINAYLYCINGIEPQAQKVIAAMAQSIAELKAAVDCLKERNRKSARIKELLVKVQDFESQCDVIYIDTVHALYADEGMDPETRRITHAMYGALENAMDAVENAAERVESVVAENM